MFEKLKKIIKKRPKLYSLLVKLNKAIIVPIISGRVFYMIKFILFIENEECRELKKLGFSKIKKYKTDQWRIGKGRDNAYRRYYKAVYQNKVAFIKIAENDSTVDNELLMANYIKRFNYSFVATPLVICEDFLKERKLLAIEFLLDLTSFYIPKTSGEFDAYCMSFIEILQEFSYSKIVHADIHKNNLLIHKKRDLIVVDFGISKIIGEENNVDYISRPGTYFYDMEGERVYDDAFSFVKMVEDLSEDCEILNTSSFLRIKERIGENTFRIRI